MDKQMEEILINNFFEKKKQERAKYELTSKKKRHEFIWKFSDNNIFRSDCLIRIEQSIATYETVLTILKKEGAPDGCYVLSVDEEIDGKELLLCDALKQVVGWGPALISCIPGELAYLESEQGVGAAYRYLLIKR